MKITVNNKRGGFTLIEMVGVLAVIAILAALLIPKIFAAINESRLNNAVVSYNSVKSAAMMYFGKYGKFAGVAGDSSTNFNATVRANWDATVLLPEGLIEKPFLTKVGTTNYVSLVAATAAGTTMDETTDGLFALDGGTKNTAGSGQYVVESVVKGVSSDDARELSSLIDGPSMTAADTASPDLKGRVKYATPASGLTDVYIYIAHK